MSSTTDGHVPFFRIAGTVVANENVSVGNHVGGQSKDLAAVESGKQLTRFENLKRQFLRTRASNTTTTVFEQHDKAP